MRAVTYVYLVFDVDVGAVVDEKTHDIHVVVYESVEHSKMQRCAAVLPTNSTPRSPLQHHVKQRQ